MKALDSSTNTKGQANAIAGAGYKAVGAYLRPDRCSLSMVSELRAQGLKVWSVYEKGYPTSDGYFSSNQGVTDGKAAAAFAVKMGQPAGTQIFAAVDYDADGGDQNGPTIRGRIADYIRAFQANIGPQGYVASVYGSGRVCRILIDDGIARSGWLTQSTGFAEYRAFKPRATIVQLPRINNSWDGDHIPGDGAGLLW
jgi:hypothetical protein